MIGKGLSGIVMLGLGFILLASTLPDMVTRSETVRTNPKQDVNRSCPTLGTETCNFTLTEEHAYPDTTGLVLTETSPSSGVVDSATYTIGSDSKTVSLTGLNPSISNYIFTADYKTVDSNISGSLNQLLRAFPLLLVVGLLGVVVFGVHKTYQRV
tara:strand:+ start:449 stop:913 length:465 start_codon:yes stop_codon:yes gene_type:complete